MPLEKTVVNNIIKALNDLPNCRAEKIHGSGYGHQKLDIHGCYRGRCFMIEAKQPGKKPTERQRATLRKWAEAGAITGVATSKDEALKIVQEGLIWAED